MLFPIYISFFSDKAPSEAVFRGKEFLSYDLSQTGGEPIVSAQDSVTFYFKTRQPNGLLFYTGKRRNNRAFAATNSWFAIEIQLPAKYVWLAHIFMQQLMCLLF